MNSFLNFPTWIWTLDSVFFTLGNTITKLTLDLQEFDALIVRLNTMSDQTVIRSDHKASGGTYIPSTYASNKKETAEIDLKEKSGKEDHILDAARSVGAIAESGLNIYKVFKKLSPPLEKLEKGVQLFNGGLKAIEGIEGVVSATNVAEGLSAIAIAMEAAEIIAGAATMLTPVGWAVGAGALLMTGAAAVIWNEKNKENPSEHQPTFLETAKKNGNQYLSKEQDPLAKTDYYVEQSKKSPEKSAVQIAKETEVLKNRFLKQGGEINFDWEKAEGKDPVYLKALSAALNINDQQKTKSIKSVVLGDAADLSAFQSRFDVLHQFPLKVASPIVQKSVRFESQFDGPVKRIVDEKSISLKTYQRTEKDKLRKSNPTGSTIYEQALKLAVQSYLTNGSAYTQKGFQNFIAANPVSKIYADKVWTDFLKAKTLIDQDRKPKRKLLQSSIHNNDGDRRYRIAANSTRSSVTINLNRPMIEHFTINTQNVKEGITDFKHKVEEVLLEILNSANVIQ